MLLAGLNILNVLVFQYTRPNFWQMVLIFVVLGGTTNAMLPLHSSLAMKFQKPGHTIQFNLGRGAGSVAYAFAALALGQLIGETNLHLPCPDLADPWKRFLLAGLCLLRKSRNSGSRPGKRTVPDSTDYCCSEHSAAWWEQ